MTAKLSFALSVLAVLCLASAVPLDAIGPLFGSAVVLGLAGSGLGSLDIWLGDGAIDPFAVAGMLIGAIPILVGLAVLVVVGSVDYGPD